MPESPDYPNRRRELWLSWPNNPKAENLKARNLKNLLRSLITEEGVVAEVISPNVGYVLIRMNTDESALKVIDVLHGKFFFGRKFCVSFFLHFCFLLDAIYAYVYVRYRLAIPYHFYSKFRYYSTAIFLSSLQSHYHNPSVTVMI